MRKYHWQSQVTGEILESFTEVVKAFFLDFKHYKIINVRWKYKKEGF